MPSRNLLFLGEWGEALREVKDVIAMLDQNAEYLWGQVVDFNRAWVHLHAMDFASVLAVCSSTPSSIRGPELRPMPEGRTPRPVIRICHILRGSAEDGFGKL